MSLLSTETSHNAVHNVLLSMVGQSHFYSPNNVGTPHAYRKSFPSIYPRNNKGFSIENPLLFAYPNPLLPYFQDIFREVIWHMHGECPHYSDYRSEIVPPKTAIYCGPHCGKFHSINATYASHGPTIMIRIVFHKNLTWHCRPAHLNSWMFPRKLLIGLRF